MYLKFGDYRHDDHEVTVSIDAQALNNDDGDRYLTAWTWRIAGRKEADTFSALMASLRALETAYQDWDKDVRLHAADGTVVHELTTGNSVSGVRVLSPVHYPVGEGAQASTFRDYAVVVGAEYQDGPGANPLRSFQETLSFAGGGPVRDVVECVDAPAQEQVLRRHSAYRATQSGTAVGLTDYPFFPPPLFPDKLQFAPQVTRGSPRLRNGEYTDWPVSWSYTYVSGTPLVGLPNRRPPAA